MWLTVVFFCFLVSLFVIWSSQCLHSFLKLSHPSPILTPIYYLLSKVEKRITGQRNNSREFSEKMYSVDFEENFNVDSEERGKWKNHLLCTFVCSNRVVAIWVVCPSSYLAIGPATHRPDTAQAPEIKMHLNIFLCSPCWCTGNPIAVTSRIKLTMHLIDMWQFAVRQLDSHFSFHHICRLPPPPSFISIPPFLSLNSIHWFIMAIPPPFSSSPSNVVHTQTCLRRRKG